jgi:hypothetical protein
MTPAPTDAVVMLPLPADEPVAPISAPEWGADLTVLDVPVAATVSEPVRCPGVQRLRDGWMLAVVAVALALAVALTVLAMVTARAGPGGATPPVSSPVVQAGSSS